MLIDSTNLAKKLATRRKKQEYQKEYNARPEQVQRRVENTREARRLGIYGHRNAMGIDLSHTKTGVMVMESQSKNRARNGSNNESTLK
jgi:hypothetical protein